MTRDWTGKRYWLVGASDGLGKALAQRMSAEGAELVLSARSKDALVELADSLPGPARAVPMDVTDAESVAQATAEVGEIDGLVFLAATYWPMKATDWDTDRAVTMTDTNYTGALRVVGAVLPQFLKRDAGHIVLTSSLSAYRGLPGAIGYGPSKAAVMSLAESLYLDLARTGIAVQLMNPGFIRTRLTDKNQFHMPFRMEPDDAAARMLRHMGRTRFSANFPWGFSLVFRLSRFLPDGLYKRLFAAKT
ncbi:MULTISPECIES: SDR family NAD(P)-dependent oxidoreductase [unclassified Meridianimarinicoccus]|uniref:SDR family NAD(P)-dependent oxidoreductase n=1 Tax=unclassified Meridianimarinicoccus TaxID=2923344 RepID=UPI001868501D|nr:SDR family NAD(P)-dependent oxidoreductase [Fluviibacterium sp. MJW13]